MEFKVASFFQSIDYNKNIFDDNFYTFEEIDEFFCIKIFKEAKTKTKGVHKRDGSLDSTDNFIHSHDGKGLVELRYVFIDRLMKRIFYTIGSKDLNNILRDYFSYIEDVQYNVDINRLESISKISLEVHKNNQMDWVNPESITSSLQDLELDSKPDKTTVHMEYTTPAHLLKGKTFQEVVNKYQLPNTKLTMRGFDERGNALLITDKVQLLMDIDIIFNDAEELNMIPLADFCSKLRNKRNEL